MNFRKLKKAALTSSATVALKNRRVQLTLLATAALAFVLGGLDNSVKPTTDAAMSATSVKIVRNDKRSGGTGVILQSTARESTVLTNGHVCKVVAKGGLVITDDGKEHAVTSYKPSKEHDLCLITVASDLGVSTKIASKAPALYSKASISGHPSLLPNIVTRGHFSDKMIVEVLTGFRKCTDEDLQGPGAILCLLAGGMPVIQRYETQVVSATIMPGSSGSAIFNENGEIAALVFAGSGAIGYAMSVPYESIANFVEREEPTLERQYPDNSSGLLEEEQSKRLRDACTTQVMPKNEVFAEACRALESDMLWNL